AVTKRVTTAPPLDAGAVNRVRHGTGEDAFVDVVTAELAAARIMRQLRRGEQELPAELLGGTGEFAVQGIGERNACDAAGEVAVVQGTTEGELTIQVCSQGVGQHDDTILAALAVPDDDLVALEVEVVDAQSAAFGAAETGAVEQTGHQAEEAV